jgi:hypothetical protein
MSARGKRTIDDVYREAGTPFPNDLEWLRFDQDVTQLADTVFYHDATGTIVNVSSGARKKRAAPTENEC